MNPYKDIANSICKSIEEMRQEIETLRAENKQLKAEIKRKNRVAVKLINEILDHDLANRDTDSEFFCCYTYGRGKFPAWVKKAKGFVASRQDK